MEKNRADEIAFLESDEINLISLSNAAFYIYISLCGSPL